MIRENTLTLGLRTKTFRYLRTDLLIIALIYLLPSLSHFTAIPFYLFEPMRLAVVFCIVKTNQKNSMIIALTLPLVSTLISSHPVLAKSLLMTAELTINTAGFYFLSKRNRNKFIAMSASIIVSIIFYYAGKFVLLNAGILEGELFSTPLWIQYIIILVSGTYAALQIKPDDDHK